VIVTPLLVVTLPGAEDRCGGATWAKQKEWQESMQKKTPSHRQIMSLSFGFRLPGQSEAATFAALLGADRIRSMLVFRWRLLEREYDSKSLSNVRTNRASEKWINENTASDGDTACGFAFEVTS
jgi:hypothetical protein